MKATKTNVLGREEAEVDQGMNVGEKEVDAHLTLTHLQKMDISQCYKT